MKRSLRAQSQHPSLVRTPACAGTSVSTAFCSARPPPSPRFKRVFKTEPQEAARPAEKGFRPVFRKKTLQDNVNVFACVLRKKFCGKTYQREEERFNSIIESMTGFRAKENVLHFY